MTEEKAPDERDERDETAEPSSDVYDDSRNLETPPKDEEKD